MFPAYKKRTYKKTPFWSVYKLENTINGKGYIGLTRKPLAQRLWEHIRDAKSGSHYALHAAIRKYGSENFKIELLQKASSLGEAQQLESEFIERFETYSNWNSSPGGYNMSFGGEVPDS